MQDKKFSIIVPTLGTRGEYLLDCLNSLKSLCTVVHVMIVAPKEAHSELAKMSHLFDQIETDPGSGLAAAINFGASKLPNNIEFFNWLGDDDIVVEKGTLQSLARIEENDEVVVTFGISEFIGATGNKFGTSTMGKIAVALLPIGPNKIPQPGAIIRRRAFESVGGLDESLGWAFDYDLFIRLSKTGKIDFVSATVSKYRWHSASLSASATEKSIQEASRVRRKNLPRAFRSLSAIWETPHVLLAKIFSDRLTKKDQKKKIRTAGIN